MSDIRSDDLVILVILIESREYLVDVDRCFGSIYVNCVCYYSSFTIDVRNDNVFSYSGLAEPSYDHNIYIVHVFMQNHRN